VLSLVLLLSRGLRVLFVVLVRIRVHVRAILLLLWQSLALVRLEVVAQDHQQLEGVEQSQDDVDKHVAIVKAAEATP